MAQKELSSLQQRLNTLKRRSLEKQPKVDQFARYADDPLGFFSDYWPQSHLYDRQQEILLSVRDVPEVVVVAGNMLGKDYIGGFCALWAFLCHPVARVVSTSVKDDHLRVLFSEINRFVQTCRVPLEKKLGGVLVNHRDIRKIRPDGTLCPVSYLRGMVSERGEGMAGHHAPYTLGIIDEASGIDDFVYTQMGTWAKRLFIFGNPNPTTNFFFQAVKGGDIIVAENEPNNMAK